jgi:hypothetical protein
LVAGLNYQAHGGGGFSFSRDEVLEMPLEEAIWYHKELVDRREKEADAIERAGK